METKEHPKWQAAILVCRQCRKRGNGPKDLKPKALGKAAKHLFKREGPRARIVYTSCLGICPKQATVVACLGAGAPRVISVETCEELESAMPYLVGRRG